MRTPLGPMRSRALRGRARAQAVGALVLLAAMAASSVRAQTDTVAASTPGDAPAPSAEEESPTAGGDASPAAGGDAPGGATRGSGGMLLPLGSLRASLGGAGYVTPTGALNFDFDLTGGFRLAVEAGDVWVTPLLEAGYTHHAGDGSQGTGDYFTAAAGLSLGTNMIAAALVPAYVVGSSGGQTIHGWRTALRLDLLLGIWSVEVSHEWRSVLALDAHSIRVMLAFDVGLVVSWALRATGA